MMFEHSSKNKKLLLIISFFFLLFGIILLVWPNLFNNSKLVEFDRLVVMEINNKVVYPDNLSIQLKEINDSRCKPDVQCVWQGEISALFEIITEGSSKEIRLGTINNNQIDLDHYKFFLYEASENNVIIITQKK